MAAIVRHPHDVIRMRRILAGARHRGHAGSDRRGAIKFIGEYLSLDFTPRERFAAAEYHYRFLETAARGLSIAQGLTLWRSIDSALRCHDLVMQPSWMAPMEGETELCFRLDGERLFTLTFSVVDGRAFGRAGAVLYVGAVQGAYFGRDRIRYAARQNDEIAPLAMLMLGLNAVAEAFGIATIVGPSNAVQVASRKAVDGRSSSTDYDALWRRDGGVADGRGHFLMSVGAPTATEEDVTGKHRARTRRRRARRIEIRTAIDRAIAVALGVPPREAVVATVERIMPVSGGGTPVSPATPVRRTPAVRRTIDRRARATTTYLVPLLYEAMAFAAL